MRTRLYLHRRLKRLLCRHVQLVSLTGAVLLIVCVLILIRSPHRTQDSVDVEFYHLAEAPNDEPYRKLLANIESKSFENGRNRTVKTAYGPVYVRDILFVPEKPLAKGANVYKVKRDRNESTYQFSRPADQVELDKVLQELNFSQEKKNRLSKLLGKAESRKSLEALGPRASRKLNQELEGSEFLKRRNREVVFSPSTNTNSCKPPCMQYLTSSDAPHYKYCRHKANLTPDTEPLASTCSFREHRPNMPLVALASPRGSGADHLRWYLQEVTGLCTGSINCNSALRRAGFVGEGIRSVSVLVVKTDQAEPVWSEGPRGGTVVPKGFSKMSDVPMFDGAVYLLRNPFHCLIQEWNDLQHASLDLHWEGFVVESTVAWQQTLLHWLVLNQDHPVIVVQYEQLRHNLTEELGKVLDFLHVPYSTSQLAEVSWPEEGPGLQLPQVMEYFRDKDVEYVNSVLRETAEALSQHSHTADITLDSYYYSVYK